MVIFISMSLLGLNLFRTTDITIVKSPCTSLRCYASLSWSIKHTFHAAWKFGSLLNITGTGMSKAGNYGTRLVQLCSVLASSKISINLWNMPCVLLTSSGAFEYFNIPLSRTKKRCKNQTTPSYCILNSIKQSRAWVNVTWHSVINTYITLMFVDSVYLATVGHLKWSQSLSLSSILFHSGSFTHNPTEMQSFHHGFC